MKKLIIKLKEDTSYWVYEQGEEDFRVVAKFLNKEDAESYIETQRATKKMKKFIKDIKEGKVKSDEIPF